jgi:hypothetical protein
VAKADQLEIERQRIEAQKEIAGMQVAANAAAKKDQLAKQQETEGMRMGIQAAQQKAQMQHQRAQAHINRMNQNRTPRKEG